MAIELKSSRELATLHGVKMLVYGRAGMGKTVLCSTAPNPVILSAESGLLSLRHVDIPVVEIKTIQDLIDAEQWAREAEEAKQFETICLDSITEIGEVVLANAKEQVNDPRQAYGELIEKMNATIKAFRDLRGKHVYMSAKLGRDKDEHTGITLAGPSMPGRTVGPQLPYLFDEVFNLDVGKLDNGDSYRYLRTAPDFSYDAKDRSGALDAIEKPDLTHIINKINTGA